MPLPRTLTLVALLWAVASLLATVGPRVPIQPTTLSYTPGIRSMVVMLSFGAFALYPVARVMTARGHWPAGRVALDAVAMSAMFTVLFWPLQLVTYWPRTTGLAVWLMVLGWTWTAAGLVGIALRIRSTWARAACALACPALLGLGALLDALAVSPPWPALCGPAVAVLDMTPHGQLSSVGVAAIAAVPWMLALAAWAIACAERSRAFAPRPLPR